MPPRSSQGFTGREITAVVVLLLGVLAAWGYSAMRKVRQSGEDSSVLCNIRQLSAAADQYFLENGVSTARLDQLVGPKAYLGSLATVAGETYPLIYTKGLTITVTGVAGARTITYAP
jgi:type IV pilus assembly protein PilA